MRRHLLLIIALCLLSTTVATAQLHGARVPDSLSFQGLLTDLTGDPVPDGVYDIEVRMYKGAAAIWEKDFVDVPVSSGVFNVILGGVGPTSLDTVAFNVPIELRITVETDPPITPLTPLTSAAYAMAVRGFHAVHAELNEGSGLNSAPNLIGGAANNFVSSGVGATIGGGGGILNGGTEMPNSVTGSWGTVAGGLGNTAHVRATVGGGRDNAASTSGTVAGGLSNTAGSRGFVGGGEDNSATDRSAVAGGTSNEASLVSFIGGGSGNSAYNAGAIGGGQNNDSQALSFIGGGQDNVATGSFSVVPGGISNEATGYAALAAGRNARANHLGSFVWNGSSEIFASSNSEQFLIRAPGGVGIDTNLPVAPLHVMTSSQDVTASVLNSDDIVVEGADAVLGLYSGPGGDYGSAVVLGEMGPGLVIDELKSKWAMVRNTASGSNYLLFSYGTSANYGANDTQMRIEPSGDVRADGAFIGGGADVAEAVDPIGRKEDYEPGDVLVVATSTDRAFERSFSPYATTVAGVYASKPGVLLHDTGIESVLSAKIPLTVVGIVPTKVTTENGPIRRGDLLVTSSTEGHAMAADPDAIRFGSVVGKALANFNGPGSGMIEVLVNVK